MVKTNGLTSRTSGVASQSVITRILASAQSQFARFGYEGARVDEIARDAGINKATLYYQIGDKAALYHAVLGPLFTLVVNDLERKVGREPTAESRLRAYVATLAHLLFSIAISRRCCCVKWWPAANTFRMNWCGSSPR